MQVPIELKIRYLSRRIQDIQKLKSSLELDDYTFAAKLGHQVKGNAVTFDVPHIASIGHEMEMAANQKDKEQVKNLMHQMETFIHDAQISTSHF